MKTSIAEARRRAGMTQARLAEALGVGQPAVSAWERGTLPLRSMAAAIEAATGAPPGSIAHRPDAGALSGEGLRRDGTPRKRGTWAESGALIRRCRMALGISQLVAAQAVGVERATWSQWERGITRPSEVYADALDRMLGLGHGIDMAPIAVRKPLDAPPTSWGQRLQARREAAGLLMIDAASAIGVSDSAWRAWEEDLYRPGPHNERAIEALFGAQKKLDTTPPVMR